MAKFVTLVGLIASLNLALFVFNSSRLSTAVT